MTIARIESGTLVANQADRTVGGLVLKFGEVGRTNLGRFSVAHGAFKLPHDVRSFFGLNLGHERPLKPIGTALLAQETEEGIYASWHIDEGPEGDALLAQWAAGDPDAPRKLSIEVDGVQIRNGTATAGTVHGAAVVKAGAFPSSTLLAADTPDDEELPPAPAPGSDPVETTTTSTDEFTDEQGVTHKRTTTRTVKAETDADGNTTTTITETQVIEEPDAAAADTNQKEDDAVSVPNTLTASKAEVTERAKGPDLQTIFASIAALKANPADASSHTLLAALSDIKISGAGALPAAGVLRENWVGQLFQGIPYERQYINLGNLGTDISAAGKKGYRVHRGTSAAPVGSFAPTSDWSGNKAAIPSGTGWSETAASSLARFAFGDDIAREFYDLPGGAEVVEAFLKLVAEDYLVWSDTKALGSWVSAAGAPIAPSATIPADYPGALGLLIQGILAVKAPKADNRRDKPSFAILNEAAFEEISYTPFEKIPEYIKFSVATDGTGLADGDVQIRVGDIGIEDTPAVLVGAQNAIEFDELANGPLWIDALNLANGGIDKAVHGYLQTFPVRTEAVVLVGEADA